jgi:hypothetical protein
MLNALFKANYGSESDHMSLSIDNFHCLPLSLQGHVIQWHRHIWYHTFPIKDPHQKSLQTLFSLMQNLTRLTCIV